MPAKIRRHLSFANVVSLIALFVALGGTALASVIITSNSQVAQGTISGHKPPSGKHSNLISGSVNATDLSSGAVTGVKIAANSVNSGHIVNGSIAKGDVASGQFGSAPATATFASHNPDDFPFSNPQQVIYTGDSANGDTGGALIHLSAPGRVLATANLVFSTSAAASNVNCRFGIAPDGNPSPVPFGQLTFQTLPANSFQDIPMSAGVRKPVGDYYVNITCAAGVTINFSSGNLIVWALPAQ
jgi:hypothetical protein